MVSNKIRTNIYIDKNVKQQAQELFRQFNISLSDAINLFLSQSIINQGIPFKIEIPNEKTQKAIKEAREGKNIEKITFEQIQEDMKKCLN